MPKYTNEKIGGHYLYFTSSCCKEPMHIHASNRSLKKAGSAKFFVMRGGDTFVAEKGTLSSREINQIKEYIRFHQKDMYDLQAQKSSIGFWGDS